MRHYSRMPLQRAIKTSWGRAINRSDDFLDRFNWKATGSEPDFSLSEVDAIYAEIINKIPAGVTKVLEIGYGDGRFYRALKAAKPAIDYVGIDIVPRNFFEAQTAKGEITVAAVQNGDTVTIDGVTLTASGSQTPGGLDFDETVTQATATVTAAAVQNGDTVNVGGVVLTASGSQTPGGLDFDETAGSNILVASSLVAAVNDAGNGLNGICSADNVGGTSAVVTLTAVAQGEEGNRTVVLASSDAGRLATSGFSLSGGVGSDKTVASSIVAAINNVGNGLTGIVVASNGDGQFPVVTIRAASMGAGGNSVTLATSNGARLAPSGATLLGGVDTGPFKLGNAFEYLKGTSPDWDFIISINCLFSYTDERGRDALFDLLDSKSSKGYIVVAEPRFIETSWLTPKLTASAAASSGVVEWYSEGARTFLTDATLKLEMQPFWMLRDSTTATPPETLATRHRFIEGGFLNRLFARALIKRLLALGITSLPTQMIGITRSGGLITGTATIDIDPEWIEGLGG